MICPRCGKEIDDSETLCPFCMHEIDKNVEFNDFRKDGYVQLQAKDGVEKPETLSVKPKYFKLAEFNIFVIAIVYILFISAFTVFSLRYIQKTHVDYVKPYHIKQTVETPDEEPTEKEIRNDVKSYSVKDIIGSWCLESDSGSTGPVPYYTFTSDGVAQENYGSIVTVGDYKDVSGKKKKKIYINLDSTLKGVFEYILSGNEQDGYRLELISEESEIGYILVRAEAKAWDVKPPDKPKLNKKLIGKWFTKDKDKGYVFSKNGTFKRVTGQTVTKGSWSVKSDSVFTVKYVREQLTNRDISYLFNSKNTVIINGVEYFNFSGKTNKNTE